jgi:predicted transcriptional regulator
LSQGRYNVSDYLVEGVMEDSFPIIPEDLPLSSIISLLKSNFAVLVTKKEQVLGIITKADLLKVI